MQVVTTIAEAVRLRQQLPRPLGFVPTMGYLHEGHLTLVRRARQECATVAVSIFVNPTQFGPQEDLAAYPRDLPRDLGMVEPEGVAWVFNPSVEVMYPQGANTWVEVGALSQPLEGAHRPGHFRGVTTVVAKLFNIVRPDRTYFGEKDAQQLRVIRKMAYDLNMGIDIVPVPTVRERDGLAMSSRNVYLNPEERKAALCLYRSLQLAQRLYRAGERDAEAIRRQVRELIQAEPLAHIEYVSVADDETLEELAAIGGPALVSLAVRFGRTRLIDNVTLR
ncbi:MAG: pantoate--beta-alanine ligase [Dehalococcoidia bacterium]|nr:pantoate--beta-alanine ligase [Dehalococcoidia bacterium]